MFNKRIPKMLYIKEAHLVAEKPPPDEHVDKHSVNGAKDSWK